MIPFLFFFNSQRKFSKFWSITKGTCHHACSTFNACLFPYRKFPKFQSITRATFFFTLATFLFHKEISKFQSVTQRTMHVVHLMPFLFHTESFQNFYIHGENCKYKFSLPYKFCPTMHSNLDYSHAPANYCKFRNYCDVFINANNTTGRSSQ